MNRPAEPRPWNRPSVVRPARTIPGDEYVAGGVLHPGEVAPHEEPEDVCLLCALASVPTAEEEQRGRDLVIGYATFAVIFAGFFVGIAVVRRWFP